MQQFGVGLAGLGNVGAGVFKHLTQNRALLRERLGYELEVKRIAVRDTKRLMRMGLSAAVDKAMSDEITIFVERLQSPEAKEAFQAFLEKRKPRFNPP